MEIEVIKFGGSSLIDSHAINACLAISRSRTNKTVVVVSAMGGITDQIIQASEAAVEGRLEPTYNLVSQFASRHKRAIDQLLGIHNRHGESLRRWIDQSASEIENICRSVAVIRELSPTIRDNIVGRGEFAMAKLFAAGLSHLGIKAKFVDSTDVIRLRGFKEELDLENLSNNFDQYCRPEFQNHDTLVMPGFVAKDDKGRIRTLGRSGSDYSATLLAGAAKANSVTLYKEVDGMLTADPNLVPEAKLIRNIDYREGAELAFYGAKVLHPKTIHPLTKAKIPLFIKNTFNPDYPGTRVGEYEDPGEHPVKALTCIHNLTMVTVFGTGMVGVPGIAARTFSTLADSNTSVCMISQSSSEANLSFIVDTPRQEEVKASLEECFEYEIRAGTIEGVQIHPGISIIAAVGKGMSGRVGTASQFFGCLANADINIVAIAQGSSEFNISAAVKTEDSATAIQALHKEFSLEKAYPLPERDRKRTEVVVLGLGSVGRSLVKQIESVAKSYAASSNRNLTVIGVSDRSGILQDITGFNGRTLSDILHHKDSGLKLADFPDVKLTKNFSDLYATELARPILVDLTAEQTVDELILAADAGFHIVMANKKPMTAPLDQYDKLFETAQSKGIHIRYEATVGAGLPILDTLQKLKESGDEILDIKGCLSGTLGYILDQTSAGKLFSDVVKTAYEKGYTEPNPCDDLSGEDVARKALILSRLLGMRLEMTDVGLSPLFQSSRKQFSWDKLYEELKEYDVKFMELSEAAQSEEKVLRYVSSINSSRVAVELTAVPRSSSLGSLKGTDNQIIITTQRYKENPLVVTGPGAGIEVTASGVLNDILAISQMRKG